MTCTRAQVEVLQSLLCLVEVFAHRFQRSFVPERRFAQCLYNRRAHQLPLVLIREKRSQTRGLAATVAECEQTSALGR